MDRPSLNSTRNFKLPPIQGAVTTSSFKEESWIPKAGNPSQLKTARITRDPLIPPPKPSFQTFRNAPKRTFAEVTNRTSSRVDLGLGHDLPRPYAVLPPIGSETEEKNTNLRIHGKSARLGRNPGKRPLNSQLKPSENVSETKAQHNRNNLQQDKIETQTGSFKTDSDKDSINKDGFANSETEENNASKERKLSATFLLFLKGKRKGRRCGVCLENERTLINVCELLKEIFLRRNMEEMYLI